MQYPENEFELKANIDALMQRWENCSDGTITFDGFYPYYFSQKPKVLFIAREARELEGCDYISCVYNGYKEKLIGGRSIGQHAFHRRLLYIAYGLCNGMLPWERIPSVYDICDEFATKAGISFAFMNLSKYSNETEQWTTQWEKLGKALAESRTPQMIKEEINILDPDIIISGNIGGQLTSILEPELINKTDLVNSYFTFVSSRKIIWLDVYHFTATRYAGGGLTDFDGFYNPICQAISMLI